MTSNGQQEEQDQERDRREQDAERAAATPHSPCPVRVATGAAARER